jgi:hypothetical protein
MPKIRSEPRLVWLASLKADRNSKANDNVDADEMLAAA